MNKKYSLVPSLFNDVVGPVMRGPSSSHTAASVRIGLLAGNLLAAPVKSASFTFDPEGALASTYKGQGSAMGLAAGLLGMSLHDPDLLRAEDICRKKGIRIEYSFARLNVDHPNAYSVRLVDIEGGSRAFVALSTGGGLIRLVELDGRPLEDDSAYINPLMPVAQLKDVQLPFQRLNEVENGDIIRRNPASELAMVYETTLGGFGREKVETLAKQHLQAMLNSVSCGRAGTSCENRILPQQVHLVGQKKHQLIPSTLLNGLIVNVTAVLECKSAMGVIVAAPTAGSCGVLAGTLGTVADVMAVSEGSLCKALLAAGLIGLFISHEGGFAAENGGCQYECGAASGMTAAALVELMGGSCEVAFRASSMALQNTLGLICDPVAGRVEVPCLGRNTMAAANAVICANMALAGYTEVIPLSQVIAAMAEVGNGLDGKYCCTCKGGLSITEAAQAVSRALLSKERSR